MADQLVGGQRFRLLTIVDNHSRESLAIEVGGQGRQVLRLEESAQRQFQPQALEQHHGPVLAAEPIQAQAPRIQLRRIKNQRGPDSVAAGCCWGEAGRLISQAARALRIHYGTPAGSSLK